MDIVLTNPPFGGKEEDGIESNFPQHFRTRETADLFLALIIRLLKPGGRAAVVLPDGSLFGEGVKTRLKEHLMEECNLHTIVRLPNSVFRPYASIGTNLLFFEKGAPTQDIWFWEHAVPQGQKAYSMTRPIRLEHLDDCAAWWGGARREGREETERAWRVSAEEVKARGYNLDIKNPHTVAEDHGDPELLLKELTAAETEVAGPAPRIEGDPDRGAGQMTSYLNEDAVGRLRQAMATAHENAQVRDIIESRDQVLARYSPMFQPGEISSIGEDALRSFFYFDNNRHWTSLYRQVNRVCADMDQARKSLALLVNEREPLETRLPTVIDSIKGMGPGIATAILHVAYPDKYGVWNKTSESGMVAFDLMPDLPAGRLVGRTICPDECDLCRPGARDRDRPLDARRPSGGWSCCSRETSTVHGQ